MHICLYMNYHRNPMNISESIKPCVVLVRVICCDRHKPRLWHLYRYWETFWENNFYQIGRNVKRESRIIYPILLGLDYIAYLWHLNLTWIRISFLGRQVTSLISSNSFVVRTLAEPPYPRTLLPEVLEAGPDYTQRAFLSSNHLSVTCHVPKNLGPTFSIINYHFPDEVLPNK